MEYVRNGPLLELPDKEKQSRRVYDEVLEQSLCHAAYPVRCCSPLGVFPGYGMRAADSTKHPSIGEEK
jgi:hypothetical protein